MVARQVEALDCEPAADKPLWGDSHPELGMEYRAGPGVGCLSQDDGVCRRIRKAPPQQARVSVFHHIVKDDDPSLPRNLVSLEEFRQNRLIQPEGGEYQGVVGTRFGRRKEAGDGIRE